jgi:hypothetical protein
MRGLLVPTHERAVRLHGNLVLVKIAHSTMLLAERVQLRTRHEYVEQVVSLQADLYLVHGRSSQPNLGTFYKRHPLLNGSRVSVGGNGKIRDEQVPHADTADLPHGLPLEECFVRSILFFSPREGPCICKRLT